MTVLSAQFNHSDPPSPPAWDLPVGLKWLAGPARLALWFLGPAPRNVIAWIVAIGLAIGYPQYAWYCNGHTACDFAGQWLMGRMFATNNAHNLYLVADERPILHSGYSGKTRDDLDWQLLGKGHDDPAKVIVEGPLYPPTAGLLFWPLAALPPQPAFAVVSVLYVQLAFLVGWFIRLITRGRVRAGEGALLTLVFPNIAVAIVLGQNSMLTLAILTAGWLLMTRGWHFWGGVAWALLAYKPVFAVAAALVPLLLLRWRMLLGMAAGAAAYVVATLPFLLPPEERYLWSWDEHQQKWVWVMNGARLEKALEPWWRWREVGAHAAWMYTYDRNWVWMSRDLTGLPRRAMWDWENLRIQLRYVLGIDEWSSDVMQNVHNGEELKHLCLGLPIAAGAFTVLVSAGAAWWIWRRGRSPTAAVELPRDAFVLFGALFTTYHFMHYDLAVFALPTVLLIDNAARRAGWSGDRRSELALGAVLLVSLVLFGFAVQAAHFVEAPACYPASTAAGSFSDSAADASQPKPLPAEVAPGTPPSAPPATASGRDASAAGSSASKTVSWTPPPEMPGPVRWAYFAFSGISLVVFLAAWGWAGFLGSWLFDVAWGVLLVWCTLDLAWVGPCMRLPFETFLFLVAWIWTGSLLWRETRALARR